MNPDKYTLLTLALIYIIFINGCSSRCISNFEINREYSITLNKISIINEIKEKNKILADSTNNIKVVNKNNYGANKIYYNGDSKDSFADGFGKLYWIRNEDTVEHYEGYFKEGLYHGKGKNTFKSWSITGEWYNGKYHNDIYIHFSNGRKYYGKIIDTLYSKGKIEFPNGDYYQGFAKEFYKDSLGTYFFNNGDKYNGSYKYGIRDGKGIYYYLNGDSVTLNYENGKIMPGSDYGMSEEQSFMKRENILVDVDNFRKLLKVPCDLPLTNQLKVHALVIFRVDGFVEYLGLKEGNLSHELDKVITTALHKINFGPAKLEDQDVDVFVSIPIIFKLN